MTKRKFLIALNNELSCLAPDDRAKSFAYYSEMIDDRMEEGFPEEEAVKALGDVKTIAENIIAEMPFSKLIKSRVKLKRSISPTNTALKVTGAVILGPILAGILISAFAVYLSLWAVAVTFFACSLACVIGGAGGIISGVVSLFTLGVSEGIVLVSLSLVAIGLVVPLFLFGKWFAKALVWTTNRISLITKKRLAKKELA